VWLIAAMVAAPWVQLSVSAGNGWPHNALRHHWLMPISSHFRDCKVLLVTSLTHVSGAIASVQTFTFTSVCQNTACIIYKVNYNSRSRVLAVISTVVVHRKKYYTMLSSEHNLITIAKFLVYCSKGKMKVKEMDLYSTFIVVPHTQGAQVWITQYLPANYTVPASTL